jgi:peptide/nickel transport system substrate-binding protein
MKKYILLLFAILISFSAIAQNKILRYATIGEPPSLDQQVLTSDIATIIAQHMFEGLYTFNAAYAPVPMLAKGEKITNNGKTITIELRKDVVFHNGKKMTSKDVVASLDRWGEHGSRGRLLYDNVDSVKAKGKYKVVINLNKVSGPWKSVLAFVNGGPVIYPSEIVGKAGAKPIAIKDYVGTGPYKMGEWRANRYLELVRFDNYSSLKSPSDGYAGKREAIFDKLRFIPVPDVSTRVSGVQAGDYDYAEQISGDLFSQLKSDSSVKVVIVQGAIFGLVFMNSNHGIFKNNFALRRSVLAAVDMRPALKAAIGDDELWEASPSFMPKTSVWYSEAGANSYSQGDSEKAKQLAKAAGYNGEIINFMVSTNYIHHYDTAVVMVKQLLDAGFKVDLKVYDWATLISKRGDATQWDMFFTHHGFVPDPVLISVLNNNYPGWWVTERKEKLVNAFISTTDENERKRIWGEIQALIYEEVPTMKTGDIFNYNITSPKLKGIGEMSLVFPKFWGVSK